MVVHYWRWLRPLSTSSQCVIITVSGSFRFRDVHFLCKGKEARSHAKYRSYFWENCFSSLPQIQESGYSVKFYRNSLAKAASFPLSCIAKKRTQAKRSRWRLIIEDTPVDLIRKIRKESKLISADNSHISGRKSLQGNDGNRHRTELKKKRRDADLIYS